MGRTRRRTRERVLPLMLPLMLVVVALTLASALLSPSLSLAQQDSLAARVKQDSLLESLAAPGASSVRRSSTRCSLLSLKVWPPPRRPAPAPRSTCASSRHSPVSPCFGPHASVPVSECVSLCSQVLRCQAHSSDTRCRPRWASGTSAPQAYSTTETPINLFAVRYLPVHWLYAVRLRVAVARRDALDARRLV